MILWAEVIWWAEIAHIWIISVLLINSIFNYVSLSHADWVRFFVLFFAMFAWSEDVMSATKRLIVYNIKKLSSNNFILNSLSILNTVFKDYYKWICFEDLVEVFLEDHSLIWQDMNYIAAQWIEEEQIRLR